MPSYIDKEKLRDKIRKLFSESDGELEWQDIGILFNIIIEFNKQEKIFTDLPEP
ncbi:hypothetical protein NEIRO03_2622, partial [Nematocida sp. AWRm78]